MRTRRAIAIAATATAVVFTASGLFAAGVAGQPTTRTPPTTRGPKAKAPPATPEVEVNSWALAPSGSVDPKQPGNRSNLSYELAPGGEVKDSVTLFNFSNVQLTFRVYATDAFNNADGQFDILPGDKSPTDVGSWVTLPQANITVPAESQANLPITVAVPADALPGDHAGAVLASSQAEGTGPDGKVITLDRRTGSRLYVRVAGPLAPELAVENLRTTYRPALNPLDGSVDVEYRVENRGNVRLGAKHGLSVSGPLGLATKRKPTVTIPELLPGRGVNVRATFDGAPATGIVSGRVTLDPIPLEGDAGTKPPRINRRSTTVAMPFTVIALALAVPLLRRGRRAYRQRQLEQALGPAPL